MIEAADDTGKVCHESNGKCVRRKKGRSRKEGKRQGERGSSGRVEGDGTGRGEEREEQQRKRLARAVVCVGRSVGRRRHASG